MRTAPVGDHRTVEAPVAFENVVEQVAVVAAVLSLIFIIGAHDGPGATLLDGRLEGRKVDLVQGPVIHDDIDAVTVYLLVVQREVLDTGRHAVLLHALHIGHDHARRKIGILAHIFEVAAIERRAADIDARAEQHVLLAVAGLLADGLAVEGRHLGIPRRRKARQSRESRTGVIRPAGLVPLVPQHLGTDAVRAVRTPQFGNAETRNSRRGEFRLRMQHGNFLFERHPRKCILDAPFDRLRLVKIDGHGLSGRAAIAACCGRKHAAGHTGFHKRRFFHFIRVFLLHVRQSLHREQR